DRLRGILEGAIAPVAEEAVVPAQTTNDQVELAVIVEVAPGRTRRLTHRLAQVAGLVRHIGEVPLAIVPEQLADAVLGHEQIKVTIVVEVTKHRTDTTRLVGDAAVLGLDEAVLLVQHEQAGAGPVEEIRPAVAVDVGNGEGVALDGAADTP